MFVVVDEKKEDKGEGVGVAKACSAIVVLMFLSILF